MVFTGTPTGARGHVGQRHKPGLRVRRRPTHPMKTMMRPKKRQPEMERRTFLFRAMKERERDREREREHEGERAREREIGRAHV